MEAMVSGLPDIEALLSREPESTLPVPVKSVVAAPNLIKPARARRRRFAVPRELEEALLAAMPAADQERATLGIWQEAKDLVINEEIEFLGRGAADCHALSYRWGGERLPGLCIRSSKQPPSLPGQGTPLVSTHQESPVRLLVYGPQRQ